MSFNNNQTVFGGTNSAFSNNQQQSNSPSFGGNGTNNLGGGVFGNNNNNTTNFNSPSNIIGTGANGIFGGTSNAPSNNFGGTQGNVFGNNSNNSGSNGVFGNTSFNKPNNGTGWNNTNSNNTTGVFGNTSGSNLGNAFSNQQQGNNFNKTFGNNTNTSVFSNPNQQTQQSNPFGGSNNNNNFGLNNSPFGGQVQQNNQPSLGINQTQNNFGGGTSPFSNQQNQTSFGNNNTFGSTFSNNKSNTTGNQNNNTYGGTSWGVPTNGTTSQTNQKFTPLKSKNHKIDHKHLVKCLLLHDQNTGMSLNELRIRYVATGGVAGNTGNSVFSNTSSLGQNQQQNSSSFNFSATNNNNNNNKSFTSSNSPFSSFSQINNNQTSSPFGGNTSITGTTSTFTNPTTNNTSPFANITNPTTTSTFGNNTTNTTTGLGGGTSIFSNTTGNLGTNQAGSALSFGNQSNQNKSPFSFGNSQNNTQGGSTFNFGTNNQQGSSMFSGLQPQNNTPLLGNTNANTSSIFNTSSGSTAMNTPSLFGGQVQPFFSNPGQTTPIPNANPDILQAIVNGGFFSSDISKQFFKQQKTPFDKLMQDSNGHYDQLMFSKTKNDLLSGSIDENMLFGKGLQNTSSNIYKFKHPFDFGEDECYDYIDYDRKQQKKQIIVKKPQKVRQIMSQLIKEDKNQKIRDNFNRIKDIKTKERLIKKSDLPIVQDYKLIPSVSELAEKSSLQVKRIENVVIQNEYGKVEFLQPINLLKKEIKLSIQISQDLIEIIDNEWDNKKCKMTFKNFGNYTLKSKQERQKLKKKMIRWVSKNNMKKNNFDNSNGNLQVEVII